jgi:hypothetical protein
MRARDASRSPVGFAAPAFAECAFVAIPSRGRSDHAVHLLSTYSVETTCGFALSLATHVRNKAFQMSVLAAFGRKQTLHRVRSAVIRNH